jgi:hypothetical protein
LIQRCLSSGCAAAGCDVMVGFPRNSTMTDILRDRIVPTMAPLGHDGAMYEVNGRREYHALVYARHPNRWFRHIVPAVGWLQQRHSLTQSTMWSLGFNAEPGAYPAAEIVGPQDSAVAERGIRYRMERWGGSELVEITGSYGCENQPCRVAARIESLLESHPRFMHTRLAVLADKVTLINALGRIGFEVCAYLPAWYWTPDARFDCILMARAAYTQEGICHGFGSAVDRFRREFEMKLAAVV